MCMEGAQAVTQLYGQHLPSIPETLGSTSIIRSKKKKKEWKGDTYNINLLRTISWITNEKHIVHSIGQCTQ